MAEPNHERHTEDVVFRLSPRLRDALERLAEREETSVSEVVRDALAPRLEAAPDA
jgi:predicted transcriptional regulator